MAAMPSPHGVVIDGLEVRCRCGLCVTAQSVTQARRIGRGHLANPSASVLTLVGFMSPDTVVIW